jgi:mannose-6-phosphate isomerase
MFDYNRVGLDGKPRELHVKKAADVLDYSAGTTGTLEQITYRFGGLERTALIADAHFIVERIVAGAEPASLATESRPLILMSLAAPLDVATDAASVTLAPYQSVLVPAAASWCSVSAASGERAEFMYVTPPRNREEMAARLIAAGIEQSAIDRFMGRF